MLFDFSKTALHIGTILKNIAIFSTIMKEKNCNKNNNSFETKSYLVSRYKIVLKYKRVIMKAINSAGTQKEHARRAWVHFWISHCAQTCAICIIKIIVDDDVVEVMVSSIITLVAS